MYRIVCFLSAVFTLAEGLVGVLTLGLWLPHWSLALWAWQVSRNEFGEFIETWPDDAKTVDDIKELFED